ncbi:ribonuclease Z [Salegentibacter mishustinae]|jgi:ribonuclease Z|uniref:Ribonuclease Z n=1 Tax=Salegentibacter mishustinae TaxID=270918 RepID=A0A0Q9ZB15_9FLAO|nr:ribonuclease Z [Salegentibacter mishustinae]KRG30221.1 ribonuclease Z [Salegentibacter mishustinae]PNW19397.1 ribonuclease Z [Salegentibacter mishustinae]PZX62158.1 ribonuclease Z [Salegentibacter mishustinae]GGW94048.1 ribonuclease Z [Salegentibacter mishustinae]
MKLNILGCYAATPRSFTNPTSQVLEMKNELFLIDCGEGTQVQLRRNKIKFNKIKHIFISHLHGDHCYGLVGLISTFRLLNRENELHVYGPKGIKEIITLQLKLSNSWTNYPLYFHELESKEPQVIYEDEKLSVETIPLIHRIYTNGFLFKEKPGDRKLLIDKAVSYNIDVSLFKSIKKGKDVTSESGELIPNHLVTADPEPTKSYAYCSDTAFNQKMIPQISGATVLYHESTFLEDKAQLAFPTKHSTAKEAALIAKEAGVKQLILGHYSTRYANINLFREEAATIFPEVDLADDGKVFIFE